MHAPQSTKKMIQVMQIIATALIVGVLVFLAIALYMVSTNNGKGLTDQGQDGLPVVTIISVIMLFSVTPVAFVVPGMLLRRAVDRLANSPPDSQILPVVGAGPKHVIPDQQFLLFQYQTSMILYMALFEGAAFMGAMTYLLEGQATALGVAILAVVMILTRFPSESRVRHWLERQFMHLRDLRADRGTGKAD